MAEAATEGDNERWPRIEGDLSAIEPLTDGYRRICKELNKAIVGQQRVIECEKGSPFLPLGE